VLQQALPVRIDAEEVSFAFQSGSFYHRQADTSEGRAAVAEVAQKVLGTRPTVRVVERTDASPAGSTIAELEVERTRARLEATRKTALNHPMVVEAFSVFGTRTEQAEVRLEGE
jgi:hypothetical protein